VFALFEMNAHPSITQGRECNNLVTSPISRARETKPEGAIPLAAQKTTQTPQNKSNKLLLPFPEFVFSRTFESNLCPIPSVKKSKRTTPQDTRGEAKWCLGS
jgi:hypothetical protein